MDRALEAFSPEDLVVNSLNNSSELQRIAKKRIENQAEVPNLADETAKATIALQKDALGKEQKAYEAIQAFATAAGLNPQASNYQLLDLVSTERDAGARVLADKNQEAKVDAISFFSDPIGKIVGKFSLRDEEETQKDALTAQFAHVQMQNLMSDVNTGAETLRNIAKTVTDADTVNKLTIASAAAKKVAIDMKETSLATQAEAMRIQASGNKEALDAVLSFHTEGRARQHMALTADSVGMDTEIKRAGMDRAIAEAKGEVPDELASELAQLRATGLRMKSKFILDADPAKAVIQLRQWKANPKIAPAITAMEYSSANMRAQETLQVPDALRFDVYGANAWDSLIAIEANEVPGNTPGETELIGTMKEWYNQAQMTGKITPEMKPAEVAAVYNQYTEEQARLAEGNVEVGGSHNPYGPPPTAQFEALSLVRDTPIWPDLKATIDAGNAQNSADFLTNFVLDAVDKGKLKPAEVITTMKSIIKGFVGNNNIQKAFEGKGIERQTAYWVALDDPTTGKSKKFNLADPGDLGTYISLQRYKRTRSVAGQVMDRVGTFIEGIAPSSPLNYILNQPKMLQEAINKKKEKETNK